MKYKSIVLSIMIVSSVSLSAQVQTEKSCTDDKTVITISNEDPQNSETDDQGQNRNQNQASRREQIMNAKIAFFTSEIELTLEEAQLFWPVYNAYWDEINKAHRETRNYLRELSKIEKEGKSDSAVIAKKLDQYVESYEKEGQIYKEYYKKFLSVLSPEKVVKLYLAEERFRDKIIEMIKEQPKKN